uniref:UBC core domain-containing protein n=1 Tax=Tetradesmus obliquus TaxID=3088 RepID=A0A383W5T2_TETOB|eukprot:jgi/Sobl393_1/394/SZX72026.1
MVWTCSACTFINDDNAVCECCGTRRHGSQHAAAQAPTAAGATAAPAGHYVVCIDSEDEDSQQQPEADFARARPAVSKPAAQRDTQRRQQQEGLYVLDCGCHGDAAELFHKLQAQAQALQQLPACSLQDAVQALACPRCSKLISNADAYKLLGAPGLSLVYAALVRQVAAAHDASMPSAAPPSCSSCPDGTAVLAAAALSRSSSGGGQFPAKQLLQSALEARQLPKPRAVAACAAALQAHLGPSCKWFCTGCDAKWPKDSSSSPAAAAAATGEVAAAMRKALQLWEQLALLQQVMTAAAGETCAAAAPAAAAAAAGRGRGAKRGASSSSSSSRGRGGRGRSSGSSAWAAGTGYGGSGQHMTASTQHAMEAAAQRQVQSDAALQQHLSNIAAFIAGRPIAAAAAAAMESAAAGNGAAPSGSGSRKRQRQDAAAAEATPAAPAGIQPQPAAAAAGVGVGALCLAGCAVLLGGPLAWLLRLLFSNDSMMDVGGRQALYREAMTLLRLIGSCTDLLPLLQLPADDPRDATPPAAAAAAGNPGSSSSSNSTLLSALQRLDQQARLFQKSAQQLMQDEGDEECTAAVCLALDLSGLVADVADANAMFNATLAAEKGLLQLQLLSAAAGPATAPAAPATTAAQPGQQGNGSSSRRQPAAQQHTTGGGAAAPAAPPSAAAAAAAAFEARYVAAMRPYQFIEADLAGSHYFSKAGGKGKAAGGEVMRKRLRRITEELGALSTSLPLNADSSILLAVDAQRMDVLRALLLPHPDTPYGGGAFLFDILLPDEYPDKPPMVQFLTTGGGKVRFNPNLYNCGKVCLSLLGTWQGPSWEPGVSTLLQVLVSLQSMVFVPDPFYNEPGYESYAKSARGQQQAADYNKDLRTQTAKFAILEALRSPDPIFKQALQVHFLLKSKALTDMLQRWLTDAGREQGQLGEHVKQIRAELAKLPSPAALAAAPATAAEAAQQQQHRQEQQQQQQERPSRRRKQDLPGPHPAAAAAAAACEAQDGSDVIDLT